MEKWINIKFETTSKSDKKTPKHNHLKNENVEWSDQIFVKIIIIFTRHIKINSKLFYTLKTYL